jgi:DNA polymerase-3 subunit delta
MPELKPAYLIHGDDHGAVAERRAGLRSLVEAQEGGAASVEVLEGEAATPAGAAAALAAMTLSIGRRVIVVEGVERWREADVTEHLAGALAQLPPDTTLALFAREEGRAKAPAKLHELVKRAGGQVVEQTNVKPWELPKWVREQAARMGLSLDAAAAKALVGQVGERQQRLLRELEKLALEAQGVPLGAQAGSEAAGGAGPADDAKHAPLRISAQDVESRAAHSSEWRAYALADALVAGDAVEATRSYLRLRQQGERLAGLSYLMAQRLRDALAVAQRLQAGESVADVKRTLRMPARAAERFVADVARSDPERLKQAVATLAQLELDTRGGAPLSASRTSHVGLQEDTQALQALEAIAGQ